MKDEFDLKTLFKYLWVHKIIIIIIFLGIMILANAWQFMFTDFKYSSIGKIYISTPATSEKLAEYKALLLSDYIVNNAVNNSNINADKNEIKHNLYISAIVGTNIYEITLNYHDKDDGKRLCISIINELKNRLEIDDEEIVSIYESVVTSNKPINFNIVKNELRFVFISAVVSIGYIIVLFYFDNKIKSESELRHYNVLGTIDNSKNSFCLVKTKIKLSSQGNVLFMNTPKDIDCKDDIITLVKEFAKDSKVLFIDTNARNNKSKNLGYSNLLSDNNNNNLSKYIKKTNNLDVMESGTINNEIEILFSKQNNVKLIKELKEKYDYVILYNSNVIDYSDSLILSKLCDCNYIFVGINQTNKDDLEKAIEVYKQVNSDVNGMVVVNKETKL